MARTAVSRPARPVLVLAPPHLGHLWRAALLDSNVADYDIAESKEECRRLLRRNDYLTIAVQSLADLLVFCAAICLDGIVCPTVLVDEDLRRATRLIRAATDLTPPRRLHDDRHGDPADRYPDRSLEDQRPVTRTPVGWPNCVLDNQSLDHRAHAVLLGALDLVTNATCLVTFAEAAGRLRQIVRLQPGQQMPTATHPSVLKLSRTTSATTSCLSALEALVASGKRPSRSDWIASLPPSERQLAIYRSLQRDSGRSFCDWRRIALVKRALDLVIRTGEHISQIAYALEYGSLSVFDHHFTRTLGLSPRQIRRLAQSTGATGKPSPPHGPCAPVRRPHHSTST